VGPAPRNRLRAPAVLALVCLLAGCGTSSRVDQIARSYIRLAVALGDHDADSRDYYYGPAEWVADLRDRSPSETEIQRQALDLARQSSALPQTARTVFLSGQLRAIAARIDLLKGKRPRFDEESQALFGLLPIHVHGQHEAEAIRAKLDRLLPGHGALADRYANFDRQFLIPGNRLSEVIDRALQGCRERTLAHVRLPQGESVKIEYVRNKPWDGYSYYQGSFRSLIQINADFPLTVDRALQLACHEGYPGHHVFSSLAEEQLVRREHRIEWMVEPVFSPQSLLSEALATNAVAMVFSPEERRRFEGDELFSLAGISMHDVNRYLDVSRLVGELDTVQVEIARSYLNGDLEYERAAAAFQERALMAYPEATLKYLNEYRTYILAYTVGKVMARECLGRDADPWRTFHELITGRLTLAGCST
jgi:hypothetical protein